MEALKKEVEKVLNDFDLICSGKDCIECSYHRITTHYCVGCLHYYITFREGRTSEEAINIVITIREQYKKLCERNKHDCDNCEMKNISNTFKCNCLTALIALQLLMEV